MRISIYILLLLLYGLMGAIGFYVARMMRREEAGLKAGAADPAPKPTAPDA